MIKIEITDLSQVPNGELIALSGFFKEVANSRVHSHGVDKAEPGTDNTVYTVVGLGVVNADSVIPEQNAALEKYESDKKYNFIKSGEVDLIEEALIPVPPETVEIPLPPASSVFGKNPVLGEAVGTWEKEEEPAKPGVELDVNGLPWDRRIHARTKTKMKDGSWKRARQITQALVDRVEAELKGVQAIPVPTPPAIPVIPAVPLTTPPAVPVPPAPVQDFQGLMKLITDSIMSRKIQHPTVTMILNKYDIPSVVLLQNRPDLIPTVYAEIERAVNG